MGREREADLLLARSLESLESLGAIPDLCEGHLAAALCKLRQGLYLQARFHLCEAEALLSRTDILPIKIQLHSVQGKLYLAEGFLSEAQRCFEKALALARMLSNPYEEARILRFLGRLALAEKDYGEAGVRLQQALAAFGHMDARLDQVSIRQDLADLFLAQEDYSLAEETAVLMESQARSLDCHDLCIRALLILAECRTRTSRVREAWKDYTSALRLAGEQRGAVRASTRQRLADQIAGFLEQEADAGRIPVSSSWMERLSKGDLEGFLEALPSAMHGTNPLVLPSCER